MNPKFKLLILFEFVFLLTWGQLRQTTYFSARDGFCSTSLLLDSLGNFYRESGCEGGSNIALGTYIVREGKIDFSFQVIATLSPFFSIDKTSLSSDSIVTITFLTRQGNPVFNKYFSVDAIDSSGKFFQTIQLNDIGQIKVNFKKYKELRLPYLERIYIKKDRLPISNRHMTVILNLPQLFFYYPRPRPENGANFSLRLKKDGLYDLTGKEKAFSIGE